MTVNDKKIPIPRKYKAPSFFLVLTYFHLTFPLINISLSVDQVFQPAVVKKSFHQMLVNEENFLTGLMKIVKGL